MKHTRRLISLLLVLALALAISPSAFAAEGKVIPAELSSDGTLSFSDIKTKLRDSVSGTASHVTGLSVDPAQGTLFQGYISEADPGAGIATTQVFYFTSGYDSIDNVTFVPKSTYTGKAEISFNVFNTGGDNTSGTITVEVEQHETSVSYSSNGDPIRFQAEDFSAWCLTQTGRSIRSVVFTLPSDRYGTMYYNYVDKNIYDGLVDSGEQYFRAGLPSIDNITLIPAEGYSGTFNVPFSGQDTAGVTVRGQVRISVSGSGPSTGPGSGPGSDSALSYSMTSGQRLSFIAEDFAKVCDEETGFELDYIRFPTLPSSSQGTLYYGTNTRVNTTSNYPLSRLGDLSFVADGGYDGTVTIPFVGYTEKGTTFSGVITIEISGGDLTNFSYTVKSGQRVYIGAAGANEIAEACLAATGAQLSYVQFPTLPSASYGTLYHNNTTVGSGTSYFYTAGNSNSLQNVNFRANDSYEGFVTIPFTATSSRNTPFYGALHIEVTDAGYSLIRYTVVAGQRLKLRAEDFANICYQRTGYPLNYVRFTVPSASYGTFYENNTTAVNSGTSYYLTSTSTSAHLLENISFVPNADYSGNFTVPYTCTSTSSGRSYSGLLYITVTAASAAQTSLITYYTTGPAARFSASDFSSATSRSLSDSLAGVRFDAPDTSAGKMYYAYTSPASHGTFVPGQSYSTSQLYQLYFLPRAGFSGTVKITYTATDISGNTATGTVQVSVTPPLVSSWFNDMGRSSWAVPAVDFLRTYRIVSGVSATEYAPSSNIIRGDFILMLSQAYGFSSAGTGSFPDVPQNSYYAAAIASARMMGIASGDTSGLFHPKDPITRQDAAVLLYQCMRLYGQNLTGTESALFGFPDSGSIAPYAKDAMAALVRFGVFQGDDHGLLRPTATLTRAEMASVLHRALTY